MNKDNMDKLKNEYDNIEVPQELDFAIEKGIKRGRAYNRKRLIKPFAVVAAGIVLALGIVSVTNLNSINDIPLVAIESIEKLPTVGSLENLQKLMLTYTSERKDMVYGDSTKSGDNITLSMPKDELTKTDGTMAEKNVNTGKDNENKDHSTTNLQVQGVDEEDLVKTDGEYIFKVNSQKIINVIKVSKDSKMEAINDITFDKNYSIYGIFLKKNTLVVVGNSVQNSEYPSSETNRNYSMKMPYYGVTKVISFDISDKKNIVRVRDIEIDGSYNSSRMIDSRVYVIANKHLINVGVVNQDANVGTPYYKDSAVGSDKINIDYNKINYLPDSIEPNYIIVAAFNIENNKEEISVNTILGSGNSIYSSDKSLYVAGAKWKGDKSGNSITNTMIYKFAYENKGVKFLSKGEVPGTITNQFSMDENNGYFRIATTEQNFSMIMPMVEDMPMVKDVPINNDMPKDTDKKPSESHAPKDKKNINKPQNQITNNLYVLDKDMKVVGKLQGLANGEQIYSVRFIGDRAYMVTFMLTDPLFVIDLKNPTSPKVLGELKIPGFSNYLHPYDETHLIGFGMDTTVIKEGGMDRAITKGMKIAIFDVSDVSNPIQQFMTIIGGRGTYSEVLNNHKALLFSKEKNLLALPISENDYDINTGISKEMYQGAYIYNIDLVDGIKLKGRITHTNEGKDSNQNNLTRDYHMNGQYLIDRILYIKDTLYTLSNGLIKANDMNSLEEKSKLNLKTFDYSKEYIKDGVRNVIPTPPSK